MPYPTPHPYPPPLSPCNLSLPIHIPYSTHVKSPIHIAHFQLHPYCSRKNGFKQPLKILHCFRIINSPLNIIFHVKIFRTQKQQILFNYKCLLCGIVVIKNSIIKTSTGQERFLSPTKVIKRLTEYARNFTQFLILAYDMCFNSKFKNQCPLTRLFHFFQRTAQTPGHDQQNGN